MGTTSPAFIDATLGNVATFIGSCTNRGVNSTDVSAALAVLDGMKPENEVEAMLLTQMWATNESAMRALGMIGKSDWIDNTAMFGNLATKLLRAYVAQVEALAKLRRKGGQTVKVVHVYPGGQAVVADTFNSGGGITHEKGEQSDGPDVPAALSPAMLGHDPQGLGVPIPAVNGKRRCRMHGGTNPGAPKGNRNALKHGRKSAATLAMMAEARALIRSTRSITAHC